MTANPWHDYYGSKEQFATSFQLALPKMCARYLCAEQANPRLNFRFGSEPPLVKYGAPKFQKYLLTNGDFSEEIRFDDGRWVGEHLPKAGNYTILGKNQEQTEVLARFSANIAGEESDLTRVPIGGIEAALGKDSLVRQDRHTALTDTLNWNEPMELFPWLMIGLLFLLALENLLANRFYRHEPASL